MAATILIVDDDPSIRELLRLVYRSIDARHAFAQKFGVSEEDFLKGIFASLGRA